MGSRQRKFSPVASDMRYCGHVHMDRIKTLAAYFNILIVSAGYCRRRSAVSAVTVTTKKIPPCPDSLRRHTRMQNFFFFFSKYICLRKMLLSIRVFQLHLIYNFIRCKTNKQNKETTFFYFLSSFAFLFF